MNYASPERLEALAAAYVLGTLRGRARDRFDALRAADPLVEAAVQRWEDRWVARTLALPTVAPSNGVWQGIRARSGIANAHEPRPGRRGWNSRRVVAAAVLAVLALAIGLRLRNDYVVPQVVAVLGSDAAHPLWQIEHPRRYSTLTIRVLSNAVAPTGRSYELWALPRNGKPVSLGLLPGAGSVARELAPAQLAALRVSDKLAVSLEPSGGSPTGSPTGPVIIVQAI